MRGSASLHSSSTLLLTQFGPHLATAMRRGQLLFRERRLEEAVEAFEEAVRMSEGPSSTAECVIDHNSWE